ncbi:ras GTPase-activating-like protein IQGAP3 isoform X1 [Varanus komodoensis]|uniref:ras GTPase-activating-like protein IQGAP3 isoform X1 n=1 Tax=Varanus komodoensis TaxID=61221 RepID=UPI001CF7E363|nr:ras GTPase-activating-like protein IQGAP3 isoform X1 [Varanus komodoensis]
MDEHRRQNVAYQYLCHLEEAKRWMEACLQEGLAPPTELEESLRNGVILARLGHFFAPEVCPLRKIYDLDQAYFRAHGLHFRHTDNISRWRGAMSRVGLPAIFHPETTDVYDKKNMPRLVYCIHALSLYLSRLGLAPQIQDLYGKVSFTEEEINHMKQELGKYGLQLPLFSKIGGILANELSVDEASVHAAVLAINRALEMGIVAQTLAALRNPSAMLAGLREGLGAAYHEVLSKAKVQKAQSATNRPRETPGGDDIYTQCLTQAEIQGNIDRVNVKSALWSVDDALEAQDARSLHSALQDPALALRNLRRENADWYLEQLRADREQQALVCQVGSADLLKPEELQSGLHVANERAEQERAVEQAVGHINTSIRRGVAEETVRALSVSEAQLPDVFPFAADLYQRELASLQRRHPQGELAHEEVFIAVEMLSAVALVDRALEDGDARSFWRSLASPGLGLSELEESNVQRYFDDLAKQKCQPQAARKGFLSWNDIQASVNRVNASVERESEKILAIRLANEALGQDSPEGTLRALLLPSAGFCAVGLPTAKRYHAVLTQMLKQKVQVTGDAAASLWWEEIQEGIFKANRDTDAAQRMALGIAAINQAVKEGNPLQTVRVLRNPDVRLCGVVAECAASYQAELGAIAAARSPPGRSGNPWVQHRLKHGMDYYFSLQTFEGTWEQPHPCAVSVAHLSREEIQSTITRVTASHDRQRLWESHAPVVARLQAQMRGFLVRREFVARRLLLVQQALAARRIQACWRGYRQRKSYRERLRFLQKNTCAIVKIQAWVRMWRARRRYRERLRYFRRRVQAVIKIQAFFRASKAREDYRLLVRSANPPLSTVRRFAHLLEQSQQDYWEELELLELQERVVRGIRHNRQLESDLGLMDIKIGLLVRNRITLQEVVSHCKKLTKKNKGQLSDLLGQSKERGLKALSKEKQKVLEGYQHLFHQLQSHPAYLARLIPQVPQSKSMAPVIFALYNYASSAREACLLLRLFRSAVQEEVRSKATRIQDILTGDPAVTHLAVSFYRGARGRSALREILAGPVQDVLQDKTLRIHTSPVDIYRGWINQLESQSGRKSDLPYDVSPEQALGYPEVQRRLDISIRNLLAVAERFLLAIVSSVDKIPYGMRYIAKSLRTALTEKFPTATAEEIDKCIGNLLYYRFMNPAVVAPDAFDVVELSAGLALHPDQRRNLGSVAKILQHAAANQLFEGESSHLRVVNPYLQAAHQTFRGFICAACCVPEPEERFSVDKYFETVAITKPVIYLTVGELVNMHKLLLEWRHTVAPSPQDPLHELLEDLGELPTVQSFIGGSDGCAANGDVQQALRRLAKTEISLVLSSKFDVTKEEAGDAGRGAKSLLLSTKQMLADVIQSQPGESLVEVLHTPASHDQETFHQRLMKRRAACSALVPDGARPSRTLAADGSLSLEEKKRTVVRNLRHLESLGLVSSASQYQSIVSEMAKDICRQRQLRQRRRADREELQQALRGLGAKRVFHEEQIDYYSRYLQACLAGLASRSRYAAAAPKQAMRRYTAAQLSERGVLLEIEGLPASQFRNVIFEIVPCGEAGEFQVKAKFMGIDMENFNLHYQDLLQLQYEGVAVMQLFGKARVNVNLLIFLLNKKFFQK